MANKNMNGYIWRRVNVVDDKWLYIASETPTLSAGTQVFKAYPDGAGGWSYEPQHEELLLLDSATPINSSIVDYNFRRFHFTIDKSQMKNGIVKNIFNNYEELETSYFEFIDANFSLDEVIELFTNVAEDIPPVDLLQITINNWSGPGTAPITLDFAAGPPTPEELGVEPPQTGSSAMSFGIVASTGKLCLFVETFND